MEYIYAVVLFALSASITPGPNTVMVMSSGLNFGARKTIPLMGGICIGFTAMVFLVGVGFSSIFSIYPELHFFIKCVGVLYLLYLAYLIASSNDSVKDNNQNKPLTFVQGALFQWVNVKAWVVATGAVAAFTNGAEEFFVQILVLTTIFFLVSFPSVAIWLLFGVLLKKLLSSTKSRKWFNMGMAALLALSVVPMATEILREVA
ncbi:LysE family translocator [Vibrio sp. ZSDZ34]|uniref:LysE family translocator n=1 Tax=Vibrio gelatinilyticus TaxID=2893468 RepID=A0A9X2AVR2_9VIBR|nr:LysE family translocator [Vibrio gelatinilyticus]MCJ2376421.1 LysE family translocator [Vibrio gelatinilyticus]